jgi:hypothetical protein
MPAVRAEEAVSEHVGRSSYLGFSPDLQNLAF